MNTVTAEPRSTKDILVEVMQIDEWAQERASDVAEGAARTPELITWATTTRLRLLAVARELEAQAPRNFAAYRELIAESLLDLGFIEQDADLVSLRTGALLTVLEDEKKKKKR